MLEFTTVEQHKLTINPEAITAVLEHRTRKEATICFDGRSEMVESIDGAATKEWLGTTDEKKDRGPTNNLVPHTPAIDEGLPQTEGPHYTPPVS